RPPRRRRRPPPPADRSGGRPGRRLLQVMVVGAGWLLPGCPQPLLDGGAPRGEPAVTSGHGFRSDLPLPRRQPRAVLPAQPAPAATSAVALPVRAGDV